MKNGVSGKEGEEELRKVVSRMEEAKKVEG